MTLATKGIYASISPDDGLRVCVMSRLTKNDGVTPVAGIQNLFRYHWKEFAPSEKLVGDWYNKRIVWPQFEERYRDSLRSVRSHLEVLAFYALDKRVTLLCVEPTPEHCHRRILAEECKLLAPTLTLDVR